MTNLRERRVDRGAVDKLARASSPAGFGGVPPPGAGASPGGTPDALAGEDARATLCHWPWFAHG